MFPLEFFFKSFWHKWLVFAMTLQSHLLPYNLWRVSATCLSVRYHSFMHLSFDWKHKKGDFFSSACLVARLLNSHYIPFPVVQNNIFLKLNTFNCILLPFAVFTGIKAGKISLNFPVEKCLKKFLGTIKKCLTFYLWDLGPILL